MFKTIFVNVKEKPFALRQINYPTLFELPRSRGRVLSRVNRATLEKSRSENHRDLTSWGNKSSYRLLKVSKGPLSRAHRLERSWMVREKHPGRMWNQWGHVARNNIAPEGKWRREEIGKIESSWIELTRTKARLLAPVWSARFARTGPDSIAPCWLPWRARARSPRFPPQKRLGTRNPVLAASVPQLDSSSTPETCPRNGGKGWTRKGAREGRRMQEWNGGNEGWKTKFTMWYT